MTCDRQHVLLALLCAVLIGTIGCARLFTFGDDAVKYKARKLPPIPTASNVVELEIMFVERPVDDPLLGFALWQEVDQIGALEPSTREMLRENGFRLGVAGSTPPRALQSMLGLSTADDSEAKSKQLSGRRILLRPGAETEIQASRIYPTCAMLIPKSGGRRLKEYANARCVYRVTAERLQDGWAKLVFLPEIHFGEQKLRPRALDAGWQLNTSQRIDRLYHLKFELTLNLAEMVVLTSDGNETESVGRHFFVGANPDDTVQRLLVVRLSHVGGGQDVYADE